MADLTNTIQNNTLASLAGKASHAVVNAIKQAAVSTGVNFAYLVQQAAAESSFNPAAKAKTSSASGLYQFLESTWMSMIDKYGAKHGIDTDGMSRKDVLALRNDPQTASLMAAEFAGENEKFLNAHWGGDVGATELYLAHFMGAGGASAFLKAHDKNPSQQAALLFPAAAKANRNVFYDTKTGRMKSLDEVYAFFDKKFSVDDLKATDFSVAPGNDPRDLVAQNQSNSLVRLAASNPTQQLYHVVSPVEVMLIAQMDLPVGDKGEDGKHTFSLFSKARSYNE